MFRQPLMARQPQRAYHIPMTPDESTRAADIRPADRQPDVYDRAASKADVPLKRRLRPRKGQASEMRLQTSSEAGPNEVSESREHAAGGATFIPSKLSDW